MNMYSMDNDGKIFGQTGGHTDTYSDSDMWGSSSSKGGMEGFSETTRLDPILEWLVSSRNYFSLEEISYMAKRDLYKQPTQQMTFRNLTEPRKRIKVADVREFPLDLDRMQRMIETCLEHHSRLFLREPEILAEIEQRRKALEEPDEDEPQDHGDTKRANLRKRRPS